MNQGIAKAGNSVSSVKLSEVPAGVSEIEAQLERLSAFITDLEQRLTSVLRSEEKKEGEPEKALPRVPLAEKLFALSKQLELEGSRLAEIVQRLEL